MGEVAESFDYGLNASAKDFDGTHKYIRITDIDDSLRFFDESNLTSPDIDFANSDNYLLKRGDILFARTGASVGKSYIHKDDESIVYFAGFLIRARVSAEYDADYIYQNTLTEKYNTFIKIMSQRSGQPGVNAQEYASYSLGIPSFEEMQKLGTFFRTLDELLAASQRKVAGLKQLKAAYLQQMFPQAGECVPRVRFEGFDGEWEIKQLGELVTQVVREVPKPDKAYKRLSIRSHAKGTFHQIVEEPEKVAMDKLYVVHENDLIVNITFAWEHAIAVAGRDDSGLLVSHRFPTFEIDKADIDFIRILVSQEEFRKKMELISPGGAGRNRVLNRGDFVEISLVAPSVNEQIAIGSFFRNLDDQIIVCQDKLDSFKHLKSAYLQKMFV